MNVIVHKNTIIKNSIIDNNSQIGYWCFISGTINDLKNSPDSDRITLIGEDVNIKSELSIENGVILSNKVVIDNVFNKIIL